MDFRLGPASPDLQEQQTGPGLRARAGPDEISAGADPAAFVSTASGAGVPPGWLSCHPKPLQMPRPGGSL